MVTYFGFNMASADDWQCYIRNHNQMCVCVCVCVWVCVCVCVSNCTDIRIQEQLTAFCDI